MDVCVDVYTVCLHSLRCIHCGRCCVKESWTNDRANAERRSLCADRGLVAILWRKVAEGSGRVRKQLPFPEAGERRQRKEAKSSMSFCARAAPKRPKAASAASFCYVFCCCLLS